MEIKSNTSKDLWKKGLNYILSEGVTFKDVYKRNCKEVLHLGLILTEFNDIEYPVQKISSFSKWEYPKLGEIKSIVLEGNINNSFAYSYGERIFNFNGFNQIDDYIIPLLKKDPHSRRAVINLWNPNIDCNRDLVPGLVFIDFKLRGGKLVVFICIRSCDLFIGWPANLYQIYCLVNYVSKKLNYPLGEFSFFLTSAHIFEENLSEIKSVLTLN